MRQRTLMLRALLVSLIILLVPGLSAQEQSYDSPEAIRARLQAIQSELAAREAARASLSEAEKEAESAAKKLSEELVTVGLRVRAAEVDADRLESQIALLEEQSQETSKALDQRRGELTELVSSLTALSRRPAAMALLRPGEAVTTARSAAILARLVPEIEQRARDLSDDLEALTAIQKRLSSERFALKNTLERLAVNQVELEKLLKRRRTDVAKARAGYAQETSRLAALGAEADTLKDLIKKLEADAKRAAEAARRRGEALRSQPPAGFGERRFSEAKGTLPYPLSGEIVLSYGDRDGNVTSRGITIKGRAGAQAVAPFDGQVVFAGPYRGYGRLVILAHDGGYHSLLAGLNRLYSEAGQWVLAGEPIGAVPVSGPDAGRLYMELRAKGSPINPKAWLARQ